MDDMIKVVLTAALIAATVAASPAPKPTPMHGRAMESHAMKPATHPSRMHPAMKPAKHNSIMKPHATMKPKPTATR